MRADNAGPAEVGVLPAERLPGTERRPQVILGDREHSGAGRGGMRGRGWCHTVAVAFSGLWTEVQRKWVKARKLALLVYASGHDQSASVGVEGCRGRLGRFVARDDGLQRV